VGELTILLGTFKRNPAFAAVAASGVIFAAVYLLWMFKRAMFGPLTNEKNRSLADLSAREIATLVPIVVLVVWIGVYPQTFLRKMDRSVEAFLARTERIEPMAFELASEVAAPAEEAPTQPDERGP
jgi:NADH-quinone oxidoreductase subunit M